MRIDTARAILLVLVAAGCGAAALMEVGDVTVNGDAGTLPNFTAVAPERLAPDIVTAVPPDTEPDDGLTALTEGAELV